MRVAVQPVLTKAIVFWLIFAYLCIDHINCCIYCGVSIAESASIPLDTSEKQHLVAHSVSSSVVVFVVVVVFIRMCWYVFVFFGIASIVWWLYFLGIFRKCQPECCVVIFEEHTNFHPRAASRQAGKTQRAIGRLHCKSARTKCVFCQMQCDFCVVFIFCCFHITHCIIYSWNREQGVLSRLWRPQLSILPPAARTLESTHMRAWAWQQTTKDTCESKYLRAQICEQTHGHEQAHEWEHP